MLLRHLLLAAAALGLSAGAQAARFSHTGTIQTYVVPKDGVYRILARGAGGGMSVREYTPTGQAVGSVGGSGGAATGEFQLAAGTAINVVVGGVGSSFNYIGAGGGGGSFVFIGATPYVIGGGGGGGGIGIGANGQSATGVGGPGTGGVILAFEGGSPGAGWFSDGQILVGVGNPDGSGKSGPSFAGGYDPYWSSNSGGFGGGGSGNPFGDLLQPGYGGGGGGGYTGGNGAGDYGGGFAGTSYVASFALSSSYAASRSGDGFVQIAAVPEPASWALLIMGFGAVGGTLRARRLRPA